MGSSFSCASKGAALLVAAANGDVTTAQEILRKHPKAACYYNYKDRTSPLIQAAGRGHFELLTMILEAAVMAEGPERAKKYCLDHVNAKRQTALMVAAKHGHPDCVEYLVTNGSDPRVTDERRHNTCLHFAALYGHSECLNKLLGAVVLLRGQETAVPVAELTCEDEEFEGVPGSTVKLLDRHNGWGLTALHIAVFQGSVSTVRVLLRHRANLQATISPGRVDHSPIRCAAGSNLLHIAALTGNIVMTKLLLEAQETVSGLDLRSRTNTNGMRPQDYAMRARNPVLVHLLDERLPVTLLRQIWLNYSLEASAPPRAATLCAVLQKLRLMLNLETIALTSLLSSSAPEEGEADEEVAEQPQEPEVAVVTAATGGALRLQPAAPAEVIIGRQLWIKRKRDVKVLLVKCSQLHEQLQILIKRPDSNPEQAAGNRNNRVGTQEAILDFILSTLVTPRTVSAILHAAKRLLTASTGNTASQTTDAAAENSSHTDAQHALGLLHTALKAADTCLHVAKQLTHPDALTALAANTAVSTDPLASAAAAGSTSTTDGTATGVTAAPSLAQLLPPSSNSGSNMHSASISQPGPSLVDLPPASSNLANHWSAHLHTLIAQLQWDIGVQRHRRRRAHAAARNAAAAVAVASTAADASSSPGTDIVPPPSRVSAPGSLSVPSPPTTMTSMTTVTATAAAPPGRVTADGQPGRTSIDLPVISPFASITTFADPGLPVTDLPAQPLRQSLSYRRGDALQDVLSVSFRRASSGQAAAASRPTQPTTSSLPETAATAASSSPTPVTRALPHVNSTASMPAMSTPVPVGSGSDSQTMVSASSNFRDNMTDTLSEGGLNQSEIALHMSDMEEQISRRAGVQLDPDAMTDADEIAAYRSPSATSNAGGQSSSKLRKHTEAAGATADDSPANSDSMSDWSDDDRNVCAICMDMPVAVLVAGCHHGLCVQCAFKLCVKGREMPSCPFCRQKIGGFEAKTGITAAVSTVPQSTSAA